MNVITYSALWSLAVLTQFTTRLSIHTATECVITPLKGKQKKSLKVKNGSVAENLYPQLPDV